MPCDSWNEKLDLYADGELSPSESQALALHMRACADCAVDALERVKMKRALAVAGKHYEPRAQFREMIQKKVSVPHRGKRASLWRFAAIPVTLVLIFSLAVSYYVDRERARRQRIYGELADLHVTTLASATPVDVISTDRHTVKPWFEGRIPFSFNLPELQGTDFTLAGGKVAYFGQTPGAQLIYQMGKHEISVFIFQDRGIETAPLASGPVSVLSFRMESWTQNGLRYFVVGDVSAGDISSLSKLFRAIS